MILQCDLRHNPRETQTPLSFLTYPGEQSQPGTQGCVQGVGIGIPRILWEHVCSQTLSHNFGTSLLPQTIGSKNNLKIIQLLNGI